MENTIIGDNAMVIYYYPIIEKLWNKKQRTRKQQRQLNKLLEWYSVELMPL